MGVVRQNIFLSLVVKFGVMAFSIAGFDNMYAAIFADVGVMIIAVLNSMRLLKTKKESPAKKSLKENVELRREQKLVKRL